MKKKQWIKPEIILIKCKAEENICGTCKDKPYKGDTSVCELPGGGTACMNTS